jgi:hypothetical protein
VITFENPTSDIGDLRTAGMILLRHGDAISSYGHELVVLNSEYKPVITVLEATGTGAATKRPLIIGGTIYDEHSWPVDPTNHRPTYTISVTHAGMRLTNGDFDELDTAKRPKGFTRALVQSRMLEQKDEREVWKTLAVFAMPIPESVGGDGPKSEHSQTVDVHEMRDSNNGASNMMSEVSRYWRSARTTSDTHDGGGEVISTTTSGTPSPTGLSFGADGSYSVLQSDYEHSPDFMNVESCSMTMTKVGSTWIAHNDKHGGSWRQAVLYTTLVNIVLLLLVGARMATWKRPVDAQH